jgi:uncharacterized protein (DUF697 family)
MVEPPDGSSSTEPNLLGRLTKPLRRAGDRLSSGWQQLTAAPWPADVQAQITKRFGDWFTVSDDQVQAILERVRTELPTTEAILIGKPQAGKSSIVRGLTGVTAEIIGQGYRPHTQYTQRYLYPTDDLPLLVFTDTVGLGDAAKETAQVIEELQADLAPDRPSTAARVIILTVKINDFATDTLVQIARQLRQAYPAVPCLLAVTCLHELYPAIATTAAGTLRHPPYPPLPSTVSAIAPADSSTDCQTGFQATTAPPPDLSELQRAFEATQRTFAGLCDRTVLIDFTLEEDGFEPVFYGLDALVDRLADLLPEAEARAMHQLLDNTTGAELGNLYREAGRRYILPFAVMAATAAAVPLPFATMPVLTALQGSLVVLLGRLYGQEVSVSQAGGIVSAIAGGFLAQAIGRELIKFIPGLGSVIAASWAAAYTWALGEAACVYFGDLMGGKKPDPQRIQAAMRESFATAQVRFKRGFGDRENPVTPPPVTPPPVTPPPVTPQ